MYHGFTGFRWPVSFYASNPASHQLILTLWECVDELDEKGSTVDYAMFDGASTNRKLTSLLLNENPRGKKFMVKNIYDNIYDKNGNCVKETDTSGYIVV